jgi:hypothetical protein
VIVANAFIVERSNRMPKISIDMREEDIRALATLSEGDISKLAAGGCDPITDLAIGFFGNLLYDGAKAAGEWLRQQNNFGESPFNHGA